MAVCLTASSAFRHLKLVVRFAFLLPEIAEKINKDPC
jgi:hypothetical protein